MSSALLTLMNGRDCHNENPCDWWSVARIGPGSDSLCERETAPEREPIPLSTRRRPRHPCRRAAARADGPACGRRRLAAAKGTLVEMKPRILCMVIICGGTWNAAVSESRAQPGEWEQMRAAIESRRTHWGRFRCQLNTVRVLPREFRASAPTNLPEFSDGMFVVEGEMAARVDIPRRRFHKSDRTPIYSAPHGHYVTRNAVTVFDGTDAFTFYPNHETGTFTGKGPYDLTRDRLNTARVRQFVTGPLFWSFGVFDPGDFFDGAVTDLRARGFRVTRSGEFVVARGQVGVRTQSYTFDPQRGWNVVQAEFRRAADEQTPARVTSAYSIRLKEQDGFWFPDEWQKSFRDAGEATVAVVDMRPAEQRLDAGEFTVPEDYLQPGMVVSDAVERRRYVVGDDGQELPYVAGTPLKTRESPRVIIFFAIAAVVVCLCAAVLIRARRSTSGGTSV